MTYNPELVNQLLGEELSKLFDGTIEVEKSNGERLGSLIVGDKITFKFKNDMPARQFVVTKVK